MLLVGWRGRLNATQIYLREFNGQVVAYPLENGPYLLLNRPPGESKRFVHTHTVRPAHGGFDARNLEYFLQEDWDRVAILGAGFPPAHLTPRSSQHLKVDVKYPE